MIAILGTRPKGRLLDRRRSAFGLRLYAGARIVSDDLPSDTLENRVLRRINSGLF